MIVRAEPAQSASDVATGAVLKESASICLILALFWLTPDHEQQRRARDSQSSRKVVTDGWATRSDGRSCMFDRSENEQTEANGGEWREKKKRVQG